MAGQDGDVYCTVSKDPTLVTRDCSKLNPGLASNDRYLSPRQVHTYFQMVIVLADRAMQEQWFWPIHCGIMARRKDSLSS